MSRTLEEVRMYLNQLEASGMVDACEEPLVAIAAQLRGLAASVPSTLETSVSVQAVAPERESVDAPATESPSEVAVEQAPAVHESAPVSPPQVAAEPAVAEGGAATVSSPPATPEPATARSADGYVGLYQRAYSHASQRNSEFRVGSTQRPPFEPFDYFTPVNARSRYGAASANAAVSPATRPNPVPAPVNVESTSSVTRPVATGAIPAPQTSHTQTQTGDTPSTAGASATMPSSTASPYAARPTAAPSRPAGDAPRTPSVEIRLPNANAGRPYDAELADLRSAGGRIVLRDVPDGLGIDHRYHLVGTPTAAGECRIGWEQADTGRRGFLLLTINADPRSLWLDKPSDRNAPYWKPDSDGGAGASAVARAVVASVRGRSHAHVGSFRDDDFEMYMPPVDVDPHEWHILVVADGAGGAKYSRRGSQIACKVVTEELIRRLIKDPPPEVVEFNQRSRDAAEGDKTGWTSGLYHAFVPAVAAAQAAVRAEADSVGASKKDFHTTLLVAIVRRTTAGAWFVGTYWIGDGAIGMWDDTWDAPKVFGEADAGEFAGETTFLTYEDFSKSDVVARRLRYSIVPSFRYFALMTDGISDPKFDAEAKLKSAEVWRTFTQDLRSATPFGALEDLDEFRLLEWMNFWSPGNHDDRTLLIFQPRATAGGDA
jgi:hypothetical protein